MSSKTKGDQPIEVCSHIYNAISKLKDGLLEKDDAASTSEPVVGLGQSYLHKLCESVRKLSVRTYPTFH